MRTRFLTPNYFTTTTQTLEFLRLPLSPLPSVAIDVSDDLLHSAVNSFSSAVNFELENLPVDDALSKFYTDVLPHTIDVEHGDFSVNLSFKSDVVQVEEKGADLCYMENIAQSCLISHSEFLDNQFSEESKEDTGGGKIQNRPVVVQFEIPELSQDVESACMSEKENILFLSEVQAHDDNLEKLNLVPVDQLGFDSKDSVNSVETICLEYDIAQKLQMPEDNLLPKDGHHFDAVFPLLEVDETVSTDFTWFCVEDEWHSLLVTTGEHHSVYHDDLDLTCQNLLISVKIDILELMSDYHTSKLPSDSSLTSLDLTVNADFLQLIEAPNSESNIGAEDLIPVPFLVTLRLEELEMLDLDSFDIFEALAVSQTAKESETSDQLLHRNQHFKSFDELIVSPELAVIDGTFTSLPVPVLVDDEKIWSVEIIVDTVLAGLEQLPFSTSDEIYFDWHLLGNEKCNGHIDAAIEKRLYDVEDYTIKTNLEHSDCGMLVLDFLLSEYPLDNKLNTREYKLDMPSRGSCAEEQRVNDTAAKRLLDDDSQFMGIKVKILKADDGKVASSSLSDDDDCQIMENHQLLRDGDLGEVASSFESMPQVNDLDFFLNPRKAAVGMKTNQRLKPPFAKFMPSGGLHEKAVAAAVPSGSIHTQQFNIQSYKVMLSDDILVLIDHLQRSYLTMIREDMQLSMPEFGVTDSDDINLLRLPEDMLIDHLSRFLKHKSRMGHRDATTVIFALCAIKRMAWCLCFYGIYNLHLFLCKLLQNLAFLKPRLLSLYSLIENANSIVDKEITQSHPSLTLIKEIMLQNSIRRGKILILAQQDFWGPLKRLLSSMNISCIIVDFLTHGHQSDRSCDLFAGGLKDHTQTVCMLVKHEHISPCILMQKFDLIVECGGPCGISKVSTLYHEHIGLQTFHFVKIELDDVARALCEGVNVASGDTDTILDGLLNFGRLTGSFNIVSAEAPAGGNCDSLAVPACRTAPESEAVKACDPSFPDMIIIVNTENFDKEMIISRRGTYQKILSMEKGGVQVVERDLMLPIDIILDAVTCIVWYDCKNIGKKATAEDEGSSNVPLCIENIATNVLTSLSFTFTACVLVFEGDSNFLGNVMESADELYAAAASLGTNIQIFCSYSFELTDEIILNYIGQARKFCKGSLPRLPETETHAESFLTKIPSINPLSAHAIISCGCVFLKYLEWSGDCRIHALRKYNLPEESVNLLSVLFKYGEQEETKSGLTDCSSSVSSPPDSEKIACKVNSVDKKRKFIPNSSDAMHEFKCSIANSSDDGLNYFDSLSGSRTSKSPRVSLQKKLPDFFLDDELFGVGARPGTAANMDPCKEWPESNVPGTAKVPQLRDDFSKSTFPINDGFGEQKPGWVNDIKREGCAADIPQDLLEDFVGEVFDIYDKLPFGMDFQVAEREVKSSPKDCEVVEDHAPRSSKVGRKLSFDTSSYLNFPMVDDLNTSSVLEDNRQLRADNDYNVVDCNWGSNGFKPQQERMGTGLFEKSMKNFRSPLSKEKFVPFHGETPLSKAIHSAQLQQGSPWTIEFLNRIKEKRRLRQQNQPWDTSVPQSSNSRNISKDTKRRSSSILEYYKYQGGSHDGTPRKLTPQRLQKQHGQLSNEKPSGLRPTCTPIDKRARRSLSFATGGAGGQTKLIWNDNISSSQDSRFSK